MKTDEDNIESLSKAILSEAEAEANQIKSEAEAKAEIIRQNAKKQAEVERSEILQRANVEAERLRSQFVATTQLKSRTQQLERREKMLDKVFTNANEKLPSIKKWTDYDAISLRLLGEALTQLKAEKAIVRLDVETKKIMKPEAISKLSKDLKISLEIGDDLKHGTGVVVEASDGRMHYDNTLETRLKRLQNTLRSPVYHLLMGETL
jgi:vacuolar-type H+-ATPase subunit E/Vma4